MPILERRIALNRRGRPKILLGDLQHLAMGKLVGHDKTLFRIADHPGQRAED